MKVTACALPSDALLQTYAAQPGCYTDCFECLHPHPVGLEALITAFYTTWLFRLERTVLSVSLRRTIPDAEVTALARDQAKNFAAWRVEERSDAQILLCDLSGATRSYLAVEPTDQGGTRLLFGSAVVSRDGTSLPWWVRGTIPLHRFYSCGLLRLAARKLRAL